MQRKSWIVLVFALVFNVGMVPLFNTQENRFFYLMNQPVDMGPILNVPLVLFVLAAAVNVLLMLVLIRFQKN